MDVAVDVAKGFSRQPNIAEIVLDEKNFSRLHHLVYDTHRLRSSLTEARLRGLPTWQHVALVPTGLSIFIRFVTAEAA
jgi:hypothetical protein